MPLAVPVEEEIKQKFLATTAGQMAASNHTVDWPYETVARATSLSQRLFDKEQAYIDAGDIPLSPEESNRRIDLMLKDVSEQMKSAASRSKRQTR